jgi:hypothetical protein
MHTAHEFPQDINREVDAGCPPYAGAALKAAPPLLGILIATAQRLAATSYEH